MKQLLLWLSARWLTCSCDQQQPVAPMLELSAEERILRRLMLDAADTPFKSQAVASAALSNPVELLVSGRKIYASEFRRNRVVVAKTASKAAGAAAKWRVFVDRGPHCAIVDTHRDCAILDGPWGMARYGGILYVASFGSDQILGFDLAGHLKKIVGGPRFLDSPEGLAMDGGTILAASFLDSRLVRIEPSTSEITTLFLGVPIEADLEAGAFRPRDEAQTRHSAAIEAELWGDNPLKDAAFRGLLRGPEHVALVDDILFVSSLHNDTLLEFDGLEIARVYDNLDGPLGLAVVRADSTGPIRRLLYKDGDAPLLLVASYRSDRVLALDLGDRTVTPLPLRDQRLIGPSALAIDPEHATSLYVACYDSGAVLYFDLNDVPGVKFAASSENSTKYGTRRRGHASALY